MLGIPLVSLVPLCAGLLLVVFPVKRLLIHGQENDGIDEAQDKGNAKKHQDKVQDTQPDLPEVEPVDPGPAQEQSK